MASKSGIYGGTKYSQKEIKSIDIQYLEYLPIINNNIKKKYKKLFTLSIYKAMPLYLSTFAIYYHPYLLHIHTSIHKTLYIYIHTHSTKTHTYNKDQEVKWR